MWWWISVIALLYIIGVIGPLWTLLVALFTWFVLIPMLSLWIAIHVFAEEASNDGNYVTFNNRGKK